MTRSDVEALGWQFCAEQPEIGYFRAELLTPSGELINMQGESEDLVVAAIEAWTNYPVQAPNSRTNDLVAPEVPVEPEAEPLLDVPVEPLLADVAALDAPEPDEVPA